MNAFFRKLRWLTERSRKEAELREELQFHLDEEAQERQALGLTPPEARWAARRELGNFALVQEDTRATWGGRCSSSSARICATRSGQWPPIGCSHRWWYCAWRWASAPTRRSTASSIRSCCVRCRSRIRTRWSF